MSMDLIKKLITFGQCLYAAYNAIYGIYDVSRDLYDWYYS